MAAPNGVILIFGTGGFGTFAQERLGDQAHAIARDQLHILSNEGINLLDTAELYPGSEEQLALLKAAERFTIHTKLKGGFDAGRTADGIVQEGQERLKVLQTKQVDTLYIHAPDSKTPVVDQVKAYDSLYRQGVFKHLGLSNFLPAEVQEYYDTAKKHGCVLPTVYEGAYSPIGRLPEKELLPLLRSLGMSYNAYSPMAGGLLAKTKEQFLAGASRFNTETFFGKLYQGLYNKPSFLRALDEWGLIAQEASFSRAELALRWVVYHSALQSEYGDGIVFGATDLEQLQDTIKILRSGPLPHDVAKKVDGVWDIVESEATFDNWDGYLKPLFQ